MALPLAVPLIAMGGSLLGGIFSNKSKNRKIDRLNKKMPKYKISEEASENQSIARSRAFGRDRSIQRAQEQVDQDAVNAAAQAQDVTNSTSDLLSTIAAINSNRGTAKRSLAQDEAAIQNQNIGTLLAANQAMIDERDKEFYQNKVAPWDSKMRSLQARKAESNNLFGSIFQAGTSLLGGMK